MSVLPALLWIALGGAAGSVARAMVALSLPGRFPWARRAAHSSQGQLARRSRKLKMPVLWPSLQVMTTA